MSAALGIATIAYLPYSFFNLINVVISFAYAIFGFQIHHLEPEEKPIAPPDQATLYGVGNRNIEPTTLEPIGPELGSEGSAG